MVCRQLEQEKYQVRQARSAEEALALYREMPVPVDLVLTDIILPGLSGVDLCSKLGRDGPALLLMSGYTEQPPSLDNLTLPLLHKPFRNSELLSKVQEVLAARESSPLTRPPSTNPPE
jgi:DNA-binding response OmpR family regulator